tara:strand:+ start:938 stop:1396 length:459 start_codon:yes stop_codon:yes gene_type:complete
LAWHPEFVFTHLGSCLERGGSPPSDTGITTMTIPNATAHSIAIKLAGVSSESARRVILETLPRELSVQPGTEHDGGERVDHARHAEHPGTLSCMVRDLPHQGPLQLRTTTVDLKCPPLPYWRGVLEMLLSSLVRLDSRTTTSEVTNIGETGT